MIFINSGLLVTYRRLSIKDPRTVAREIPSIFDAIFPQLTPGIIAHFNRSAVSYSELSPLPDELVQSSNLQQAMLFEIGYARSEQILRGVIEADWNECLAIATSRQQHYFDAQLPKILSQLDMEIAEWVALNLSSILKNISSKSPEYEIVHSPKIPGYQWVDSGEGDFSIGQSLIEVKCTARSFGAADYRQVLMYWLLSYVSSLENDTFEWNEILLLNPRKNCLVEVSFNEIIEYTAAGKSKIEIVELFSSMIGDYALKALPDFRF